jgi:serine/threonine protein phosphatase PrpC
MTHQQSHFSTFFSVEPAYLNQISPIVWPQVGDEINLSSPIKLTKQVFKRSVYAVYLATLSQMESTSSSYEVWVIDPTFLEQVKEILHSSAQAWNLEIQVAEQKVDTLIYLSFPRKSSHEYQTAFLNNQRRLKIPIQEYNEVIKTFEPLFQKIIELHQNDLCMGGFHPSIWVETQESLEPQWMCPLYKETQAIFSISDEARNAYLGYSPPESYGYFKAEPSKQSDVFSLGMCLYYRLTSAPLFPETRRPFTRLPTPQVYHTSLIAGLVAVIRKATSPFPKRRYLNAEQMWKAICRALSSHLQRQEQAFNFLPLSIEIGHDIHIGLLKGQYNPTNQDDLFLAYQPEQSRGLFVISDGVSISEYGSGDIASGYVRQEAFETWRTLTQVDFEEEEETLSEFSLEDLQQNALAVPETYLRDMLNRANQRIGEYINSQYPHFRGPAEGIMGATAVAALIDRNQATLCSVGDSRIYLIRDGHICNLATEDDYATYLMMSCGQLPTQAQQTPSSAALMNCVGKFRKDEERQCVVPNQIQPQIIHITLLPGDYLVLCSDGIPDYGGVDEEDAEQSIVDLIESAITMPRAAFELITLANRGGGGDNLSCIVLRFYEEKEDF